MNPLEQIIQFLKSTDELKTASTLLSTFAKYSSNVDQHDIIARLYHDIKDYQNSIIYTEKTLALAASPQQLYVARANLAKLYNHINNPDKALQYINANLTVNPTDYEAMMEKVFALYLQGNTDQSKQLTEQLLNDPNTPEIVLNRSKYNYGSYLLEDDQFQKGLKYFIGTGHDIGIWTTPEFPGTKWEGDIQPNKNIAILAEGGIGDEIINIRFIKHIQNLGMNPLFVTNRLELVELFNRNNLPTVKSKYDVPEDSEWCYAMYLPILLNIKPEDLWNGPYLIPSQEYTTKWKDIFNQHNIDTTKAVAIRWQGNQYYEQNLHRSISLKTLDEKLDLHRTDIQFVSVQKDDYTGIEQYPVFNAAPFLETLEDLLACLSLMKYTITSCTSVAHVAAAAGLPMTVLPPIATYYVWLGTTKWYSDNCTILRQRKLKDFSHLNQIKL